MKRSKNALAEMGTYCNWELHKLAKTLLAWAVLIESLSAEHEKLAELEGFGMALQDYSETVESIRSSLDDLEIGSAGLKRDDFHRFTGNRYTANTAFNLDNFGIHAGSHGVAIHF